MAVSELELAWFAGLMEGEGTFFIDMQARKGSTARPQLVTALDMTDLDVVERAAALFPTRTSIYRRSIEPRRRKECFKKKWRGADAERVMRAVLPYMCERRRAKIIECLNTPNLSHHPKGT